MTELTPRWIHRPLFAPDTPGPLGHGAERGHLHFTNLCTECMARVVVRLNLGEVEAWFRDGRIGLAFFEAYRHVWRTSEFRYSSACGDATPAPTDPEVVEAVQWLQWAREVVAT
jgi:hypothetical protein